MDKMPYLYRLLSAKVSYNDGSFAERDMQLKASYASLPFCIGLTAQKSWPKYVCVCVYVRVYAYGRVSTPRGMFNSVIHEIDLMHKMPSIVCLFPQKSHYCRTLLLMHIHKLQIPFRKRGYLHSVVFAPEASWTRAFDPVSCLV